MSDDHLALQALLYAGGELDGTALADFERRLAADQEAREALCQAVQLTQALAGDRPGRPDPAYRARVRQRLGKERRKWPVGPVVWASLGAAAAVLITLGLNRPETPVAPTPPPAPVVVVRVEPPPVEPAPVEDGDAEPMLEMANVWAELTNSDHLARAVDREVRRKLRQEDRRSNAGPTLKN